MKSREVVVVMGTSVLIGLDRLDASREGGVLLDVLAVLLEGGGADGLQLTAGQHGLEDAGGIDRALGCTRTHQGVDLVDEQDDVAARSEERRVGKECS